MLYLAESPSRQILKVGFFPTLLILNDPNGTNSVFRRMVVLGLMGVRVSLSKPRTSNRAKASGPNPTTALQAPDSPQFRRLLEPHQLAGFHRSRLIGLIGQHKFPFKHARYRAFGRSGAWPFRYGTPYGNSQPYEETRRTVSIRLVGHTDHSRLADPTRYHRTMPTAQN